MEPDLTIWVLTNQDPRFYPLLGPYLSRRAIVAELGGPVWDDDGKTWWVAVDHDGAVAGFCAASAGDPVVLESAWVPAGRRHGKVYQRLFAARLAALAGRRMRSRVAQASTSMFTRHGFTAVSRHGRFTEMRLDASKA